MKVVMNEKRVAIVDCLKVAENPMTLAELTDALGFKVASGTTNPMVEAGYIKKVGTVRVPVTTYREVAVYEIGDVEPSTDADGDGDK